MFILAILSPTAISKSVLAHLEAAKNLRSDAAVDTTPDLAQLAVAVLKVAILEHECQAN